MKKTAGSQSVDEYLASFPADTRSILEEVRQTIRRAAPNATEIISYGMPAYRQYGILVYFAGWQNHVGLYPPLAGDAGLQKASARYAGPKGNLQFPLREPMPLKLIEKIVKLRVRQDEAKSAGKRQ